MRTSRLLAGAALAIAVAARLRPGRSLRGAVVLITGGSRGLGLLLARQFGRQGARLAICARNNVELTRARKELEQKGFDVLAIQADVSHRDSARNFVERTVQHYGRLDIIVNNAGAIHVGPMEAMTSSEFHDAMGSIFWGAFNITQAALPFLRRSRVARVVNITSIGGAVAVPHLLPYSAAKFAMVGYSTGLAVEVRRHGIQVVTVLPGLMRTGSFVNALVKGHRAEETAWFSLLASMPVLSMHGERAARRIVAEVRRGTPYVTLGMPAKVLRLAATLFPATSIRLMGAGARLLPGPLEATEEGPATRAGEHRQGVAQSRWVVLGDRAAAENNEESVPPEDLLH